MIFTLLIWDTQTPVMRSWEIKTSPLGFLFPSDNRAELLVEFTCNITSSSTSHLPRQSTTTISYIVTPPHTTHHTPRTTPHARINLIFCLLVRIFPPRVLQLLIFHGVMIFTLWANISHPRQHTTANLLQNLLRVQTCNVSN